MVTAEVEDDTKQAANSVVASGANSPTTFPTRRSSPKTMKPAIFALALLLPGLAVADPAKPLVRLEVKKQVLDSAHDLHGRQGSSARKVFALRVEVTNTSSASLESTTLTGEAIVERAKGESKTLVKEPLGKIELPALKPNERTTADLGKITLNEVEWRNRKFEESLEEWKVTCLKGPNIIGTAVSSDRFIELEHEAASRSRKDVPNLPGKKRLRGKLP